MSARAAALQARSADGFWFEGKLKPHQRPAVDFLLDHPRAVLADDVGLGKTPSVLAYIGRLEERGLINRRDPKTKCRILWITDPSLLAQTKAEIERFLPDFSVLTSECPEMRGTQKAHRAWAEQFGQAGPDIIVLGYSMASARLGWIQNAMKPNLVVLDEASKINGGGKQFEAVREITKSVDRVVSMTATPVENDGMELWHVLAATQVPGLWPKHEFERGFITWVEQQVTQWTTKKRADGWVHSRIPEVREFLKGCMIQRSAEAVGLPLPQREGDRHRHVQLTPAEHRAYELASEKQGQATVQKMESIGRASRWLGDALVDELRQMGDRQSIVYCETLAVLDMIQDRLTAEGITFRRVEGQVSQSVRESAVQAFRDGEVRVFLGSRVLERGLNLQHCRDLISLDPSWNPARERQREGRIRRIGSPHKTYRHLSIVPDTSIARAKLNRLDRKQAVADAVNISPWPAGQ